MYGLRCPFVQCNLTFDTWEAMISHSEYCVVKTELCPCGQTLPLLETRNHLFSCDSVVNDSSFTADGGRVIALKTDSNRTYFWEFLEDPHYSGLVWIYNKQQ